MAYHIYRRVYLPTLMRLPTCQPTTHPEDIYTGLIIYIRYVMGHAGLLSSRVIAKARYGVCIVFRRVWGACPQASYYDKPIP